MSIRDTVNDRLKEAMRAKDSATVLTLRLINATIKDKDIAARTADSRDGISDEQILATLQTMIKQRRESIKLYIEGKRPELAEKEKTEIKIIENFLPQQMSEDEIKTVVGSSIASLGAQSMKDMGKVMSELKSKYVGQMDFSKASSLVKEALG